MDGARFVYNYMLRLCADTWYRQQTRIGYSEMTAAFAVIMTLPRYHGLISESPKELDKTLRDLDADFEAFYSGRAPYPSPRTRHNTLPSVTPATVEDGFPTVTRCFDCGYLADRAEHPEWTCPDCGVIHDTDFNATRNAEAVRKAMQANGYGAMLPPV